MLLNLSAPKDAPSALRFCKCAEKSATMKAEGYTMVPLLDVEDAVFVHKPNDENGVYVGGYAIDLRAKSCNCPDFANRGDFCKHLLFVAEELRAEDRTMWTAICERVEAEEPFRDIAYSL
jgi:hypothetical protein